MLGPLEAGADGRPLDPAGRAQAARTAGVLLLHPKTSSAIDRLIEGLWGERARRPRPRWIQLYVSQLRKCWRPRASSTRAPGYALQVEPGRARSRPLRALAARARRCRWPTPRRQRLREALALWRGPPLDEFAYEPFAGPTPRLEELRFARLSSHRCRSRAGRARAVLGEIEALVAEHPLRERLHAQLMLALYRCGRQADALGAYRHARDVLVRSSGSSPAPRCAACTRRSSRQDPRTRPRPREPRERPGAAPRVRRPRARARRPRRRVSTTRSAAAGACSWWPASPASARAASPRSCRPAPGARRAGPGRALLGGGRRPGVLALGPGAAGLPRDGAGRAARSWRARRIAQALPELRELFPDLPAVARSEAARFRLFEAVALLPAARGRVPPLVLVARRRPCRRRAVAAPAALRRARDRRRCR